MSVEAIDLKPVPLRGGPYRNGEPAYGLFERLAKRAKVSPVDMACDHGLRWKRIREGKAIDEVAALADVDAAFLRRSTLVVSPDQTVDLGGAVMDGRLWNLDRKVHCPACSRLDQEGDKEAIPLGASRRVWWDCIAVDFCHEHRVPLEPTWTDGDGHASRSAEVEAAFQNDVAWEAYLVGRLGFGPRQRSEVLDELSVVDAMVSAALFGWVARFGKRVPINKAMAFRDGSLFRTGYAIIESGASLCAFLDERWKESSLNGPNSRFKVVYGELHNYYFEGLTRPIGFSGEDHGAIRNRIAEHALSRLPLDPDPEIFRTVYTGRGLPRMPGAYGKYYAWEIPFFRVAVGLGLLDPNWSTLEWRLIGIPLAVMEKVDAFIASTVTSRELARLLGISGPELDRLIASGWFVPVLKTDLNDVGETYFSRSSVGVFMDRIAGSAPLVAHRTEGNLPVKEWGRRSRMSPIRVIERLLKAELTASGRLVGVEGCTSILLSIAG